MGLGPFPRQPQPTPNAQSPPPRCTSPPEGHPREAGARGGEEAPGVAPTACRGDPGPALEVRARRPSRGGAPGLEAPVEPLSGPRWAHPGPRGRAGPPQPAAVEGDECGQPPRARAATHRPRAARRPPPGATAPPGRGVTAVSAARCASPPTGPPAGSRPLLLFYKNDCDFFQELYWQKNSEPADRCGPAAEGRARETRLPSAADAPHSEHAPDFQCARARRRPRPAAPPPSWPRLRGAAFPVRQLWLVGFQEAGGRGRCRGRAANASFTQWSAFRVLTGRALPGCTSYTLDRRTSKWRSEQNWSKVENALGPYSVTGPSAKLRCLIIKRTKRNPKVGSQSNLNFASVVLIL